MKDQHDKPHFYTFRDPGTNVIERWCQCLCDECFNNHAPAGTQSYCVCVSCTSRSHRRDDGEV